MKIKLYNTLTKQVEELKPLPERGNAFYIYTCGPTVYNLAHIGNHRSYIFADLLQRVLRYNGFEVRWVMNITDIDDKTIKGTIQKSGADAGLPELKTFTTEYLDKFLADLKHIGIDSSKIEIIPVTDKIAEMQEFTLGLIEKGYAYTAADGSTYFNIQKYQEDFGDYGQLVGEGFLAGKKTGTRVSLDEYEKENVSDFALWKIHAPEDGNIFWEHEKLGKGRPGWHIECSVVNDIAFDHSPTDIHTGGVDLMFPHHTNEIAQSQPYYKPFTRYWSHCEHLLVDNKKMAKSAGNFYTLAELKFPGIVFRYAVLQTHFRAKMNFTEESLEAANTVVNKLYAFVKNAPAPEGSCEQFEKEFLECINDDLNIPKAMGVMWTMLSSSEPDTAKHASLLKFDKILGLNLDNPPQEESAPQEVIELAEKRQVAKQNKDYNEADHLREEISDIGYEISDTSDGFVLRKN